jgi:hypothetical protein
MVSDRCPLAKVVELKVNRKSAALLSEVHPTSAIESREVRMGFSTVCGRLAIAKVRWWLCLDDRTACFTAGDR